MNPYFRRNNYRFNANQTRFMGNSILPSIGKAITTPKSNGIISSLLANTTSKSTGISSILGGLSKTVTTINQALPIINQVKPLLGNVKPLINLVSSFRNKNNTKTESTAQTFKEETIKPKEEIKKEVQQETYVYTPSNPFIPTR